MFLDNKKNLLTHCVHYCELPKQCINCFVNAWVFGSFAFASFISGTFDSKIGLLCRMFFIIKIYKMPNVAKVVG